MRGKWLDLIPVHLVKGVARIARKLDFDYAEAVVSSPNAYPCHKHGNTLDLTFLLQTGFEFKKRRAFPIVEGVVVAAENEPILLEVRRGIKCSP